MITVRATIEVPKDAMTVSDMQHLRDILSHLIDLEYGKESKKTDGMTVVNWRTDIAIEVV